MALSTTGSKKMAGWDQQIRRIHIERTERVINHPLTVVYVMPRPLSGGYIEAMHLTQRIRQGQDPVAKYYPTEHRIEIYDNQLVALERALDVVRSNVRNEPLRIFHRPNINRLQGPKTRS